MKFKEFINEEVINETRTVIGALKNIKSIVQKIDVSEILVLISSISTYNKLTVQKAPIDKIIEDGHELTRNVEFQIKKCLEVKHDLKTTYLDDSIKLLTKIKNTVIHHIEEEREKYKKITPEKFNKGK